MAGIRRGALAWLTQVCPTLVGLLAKEFPQLPRTPSENLDPSGLVFPSPQHPSPTPSVSFRSSLPLPTAASISLAVDVALHKAEYQTSFFSTLSGGKQGEEWIGPLYCFCNYVMNILIISNYK